MTGPAEGKISLDSDVYLNTNRGSVKLEDAEVYIHMKGYSLARVTHLDVEHEILDNIIPPKRGRFLSIRGIKDGIEIILDEKKELSYRGRKFRPAVIQISCPILSRVLKLDQDTRTWVGGKFSGIYIGFRKNEVEKLEQVAEVELHFKK